MDAQLFGSQVKIKFWWKPSHYIYPSPISEEFRTKHTCAAVYRWAIYPPTSTSQDPCEQYVGETQSLARRLQQYLKPGKTQRTNQRLKEILDDKLASGARIELHTFEFEPFEIVTPNSSVLVSTFELFDQFKRKMMENFAILVKPEGCRNLDLAIDPISRAIRTAQETRKLRVSSKGREQLCQDADMQTLLEIRKRSFETDSNAQKK